MARILMAASGYWGDVLPLIPVAEELTARGHHVDVAAPSAMREMLEGQSFTLRAAGAEVDPADFADDQPRPVRALRWLSSSVSTPLTLHRGVIDPLEETYEEITALAAKADVVVVHPAALAARLAAEVHGVPWLTLHLFPMYIPTSRWFPGRLPPHQPPTPVGQAWNRLGWWGYGVGSALIGGDRRINRFRRRLGLRPVRANMTVGSHSPHRILLAVSPAYLPRPPDWSDRVRLCGFLTWSPASDQLPAEIDRYLAEGEPPVLVTLGSSAANHSTEVFDVVAAALDDLGLRGLFLTGSRANRTARLEGRDGVWDYAPLSVVLPRCRAAVHSGSLGTNADVLRAGRPALVVPDLIDQGWHGGRLEQLGLGLSVSRRRRSVRRVRDRLAHLLETPAFTERARSFASRVADEDAATAACDAIEELL